MTGFCGSNSLICFVKIMSYYYISIIITFIGIILAISVSSSHNWPNHYIQSATACFSSKPQIIVQFPIKSRLDGVTLLAAELNVQSVPVSCAVVLTVRWWRNITDVSGRFRTWRRSWTIRPTLWQLTDKTSLRSDQPQPRHTNTFIMQTELTDMCVCVCVCVC